LKKNLQIFGVMIESNLEEGNQPEPLKVCARGSEREIVERETDRERERERERGREGERL
jgi:hypothetical protein